MDMLNKFEEKFEGTFKNEKVQFNKRFCLRRFFSMKRVSLYIINQLIHKLGFLDL